MPIYYTDKELNRLLGVEDFHRTVKPFIIADARKLGFLRKLKGAGNPDIGLEGDIIFLRDPRNHRLEVETNLEISSYI